MGHGSYTAADWNKLRTSKKMDSSSSETEIFRRSCIDPRFDPQFIGFREALDSEDHPNSTPIIIGLDVTASMGYVANVIAREALNETMLKLYSTNAIEDPAIMFAAYGDAFDSAPLQVTQFESDIRIAEQLMELWLEFCGSGDVVPSLLWKFAADHTKLDAHKKRNKKGFIITIGDDADQRSIGLETAYKRAFPGENVDSPEEALKRAEEKFEVMHIMIAYNREPARSFTQLLPGRYMTMTPNEVSFLPEIIISAMQIVQGQDREKVIEQWSDKPQASVVVRNVVSSLTVGNNEKGFTF